MFRKILSGILIIYVFQLLPAGCRHEAEKADATRKFTEEDLMKVNKFLVKKDQELIHRYVERHGYPMEKSPSGLWFGIITSGDETFKELAQKDQYALISYSISLLDGTLCYSSDSRGLKQFRIGQGGVESGLEEGILKMHVGDSARMILPPHLGYGLTGDQQKIPGRAILVYDVKLLKLSPQMIQTNH